MTAIDTITEREIKGIHLFTWDDEKSRTMIESVHFDFGDSNLIITVDKDYDTIELSVVDNPELKVTDKEHKILDCLSLKELGLETILGKKIVWLWTMTNNQGYKDGIQIELDDQSCFQFLVVASDIKVRKIVPANLPSR